ncbi:MAG TPA: anthranilate synthase component I [bacterium]|nr:anthranilate synthase component I [bacterium]HPQ66882.1 anthranilate synthase component I [bacterium]
MYYPDRELFRRKCGEGNLIPVYTELIADLETPVSVFLKLGGSPYAYLLESAEAASGLGRYSFLGSDPALVFLSRGTEAEIIENGETRKLSSPDPLLLLRDILKGYRPVPDETLPPFAGGAVGYFSYDCVRFFERIPDGNPDELELPDLYFMVSETLVVFDRLTNKIKIVANARVGDDPDAAYDEAVGRIETVIERLRAEVSAPYYQPAEVDRDELPDSNFSAADFEGAVKRAQEYIRAGDILQTVLSQRFCAPLTRPAFDCYRALRTINPSPYMFFLKFRDLALVGSSPEINVQVVDDRVRVRPIAGTRPRGASRHEDDRLERELLDDPKERAEHVMLVDLGRNDVGRVSIPGSVRVEDFMTVERYSHVMHIVSNVEGTLAPGEDAFSAFAATFPAGTVSGAPKIRAMEIIDELEPVRRGPYAGAVGYFSFDGNLDSCITIRTIVVKDGKAYIQAGAGIVADSVPEREYRECVNKARALFQAVRLAQGGLK